MSKKKRRAHKDRKQKKDRRKWKRSGIYEDISDHINVYSYDPEELEKALKFTD